MPNGGLKTFDNKFVLVNGEPVYKLTACNVAVSSREFVWKYVEQ